MIYSLLIESPSGTVLSAQFEKKEGCQLSIVEAWVALDAPYSLTPEAMDAFRVLALAEVLIGHATKTPLYDPTSEILRLAKENATLRKQLADL